MTIADPEAGPVVTRQHLVYRSVLQIAPGIDLERLLRSEVDAWLRTKEYRSAEFGPTWVEVAPGAALIWPSQATSATGTRGRMRLSESTGWETRVTYVYDRAVGGWLCLDIRAPYSSRAAKVPRLLRNLLPLLDARDGLAAVGERSTLVRAGDVDELIDVVCDPDRRGVVFVAGTDASLPAEPWRALVDQLAFDTVGMAATYLLDTEATVVLSERLGGHAVPPGAIRTYLPDADPASRFDARRHRILGTSRLANDSPRSLARILAGAAAEQMVASLLPHDLVKAHRALDRLETSQLVSSWSEPVTARTIAEPGAAPGAEAAATPTLDQEAETPSAPAERDIDSAMVGPPMEADSVVESPSEHGLRPASAEDVRLSDAGGPELEAEPLVPISADQVVAEPALAPEVVEAHLALVAGIERLLGQRELSAELVDQVIGLAQQALDGRDARARIESRLEQLQSELETVEDRATELRARLEDSQENLALTQDENNELADKVAHLQRALEATGHGDLAWEPVPEAERVERPGSFTQLVAKIGDLDGVFFSGDAEITAALDHHDQLGTLADKAWDVLLALRDYVAAKRAGTCNVGLPDYLRNPPPGARVFSANQFVPVESDAVRNHKSWRAERVFAVPERVDPSGEVFMEAHFRLGAKRTLSPRIYIYDATGKGDAVFVGYIGPHLTNTKT